MIEFTIETEIARPVSDVFAYVTDPDKLATWQTNTVSAVAEPAGPIGIGTRIHEVHRAPGGKQLASGVEVSEYDVNATFALHMIDGPLPIDARFTFTPTESSTRMTFAAHGHPSGPMRLAQPLLRRTLKRQFLRLLRDAQTSAQEPPTRCLTITGRRGGQRR
jgi:uncharacterized protein YndB with AHSA1/START domain